MVRTSRLSIHWNTEKETLFISGMEEHAFMWDPKHDFYHKREKRDLFLAKMCQKLGPEFTATMLKKKWKSLRDQFLRYKKKIDALKRSGAAGELTELVRWKHFNHLQFLNDTFIAVEGEDNAENLIYAPTADSPCEEHAYVFECIPPDDVNDLDNDRNGCGQLDTDIGTSSGGGVASVNENSVDSVSASSAIHQASNLHDGRDSNSPPTHSWSKRKCTLDIKEELFTESLKIVKDGRHPSATADDIGDDIKAFLTYLGSKLAHVDKSVRGDLEFHILQLVHSYCNHGNCEQAT